MNENSKIMPILKKYNILGFSILSFMSVFVSCSSNKNSRLDKHENVCYAPIDSNHFQIIRNVLMVNSIDSIFSTKCYYGIYFREPENKHIIDSSNLIYNVIDFSGNTYKFSFYIYSEGFISITKNGKVVFVNNEYPQLPDINNILIK